MNQAGVFSCPAKPCRGGEGALDNGPGVDVRSRLEFAKLLVQLCLDRANSLQQNLVIVAGPPLTLLVLLVRTSRHTAQSTQLPRSDSLVERGADGKA